MEIGSGRPVELFVTVRTRMGTAYGFAESDVEVRTSSTVLVGEADAGKSLVLDLPADLLARDGRGDSRD